MALLPTGAKKTSEAAPTDVCVSATPPENAAREQPLISLLQIYIYVFSRLLYPPGHPEVFQ